MSSVFVELKAVIGEFNAKMAEARAEMAKTAEEGSSSFFTLGKSMLAIGGGALAVGGFAVKMASEFDDAHRRMVTAVENTGRSFDVYKEQVGHLDKVMENLGFTNTQTEEAFGNLTTALGDPTKATVLLGTAADLARFKHIGLADASTIVAKAFEGQLKPLKALGIDIPVVASNAEKVKVAEEHLATAQQAVNDLLAKYPDAADGASKAHAKYETAIGKVEGAQKKLNDVSSSGTAIIEALKEKIGGQAATAAETLSGKWDILKAKTEDLGVKIGEKLIPILEKVIGWVIATADWWEREWPKIKEVVTRVWADVQHSTETFIAWVEAHFGGLFDAVGRIWGQIKGAIVDAYNGAFATIHTAAGTVESWWGQHHQKIEQIAGQWWGKTSSTASSVWGDAVGAYNGLVAEIEKAGPAFEGWWRQHHKTLEGDAKTAWDSIRSTAVNVSGSTWETIKKNTADFQVWWKQHHDEIEQIVKVAWDNIQAQTKLSLGILFAIVKSGLTQLQAIWKPGWDFLTQIVQGTLQTILTIWHTVFDQFLNIVGIGLDVLTGRWGRAWTDLKNLMNDQIEAMLQLLHKALPRFLEAGANITMSIGQGILQAIPDLLTAPIRAAQAIINKVKEVFHMSSPSQVMFDIGVNLIKGLENGIVSGLGNMVLGGWPGVIGAITNAVGAVGNFFSPSTGGNVTSWLRDALQATGAPILWLPMLQQMVQMESGGNPAAANRTPAGIAAGGPVGLLQTIPSTFGQYALPGHGNILNPVDNAIAAIRYIQSRYGSPLAIHGIPGFTSGSYVGYDVPFGTAGILPPGVTMAYNATGMNEYISRTPPGESGGGGGGDLVLQIDGQTLARVAGPQIREWLYRRGRQTVNLAMS